MVWSADGTDVEVATMRADYAADARFVQSSLVTVAVVDLGDNVACLDRSGGAVAHLFHRYVVTVRFDTNGAVMTHFGQPASYH